MKECRLIACPECHIWHCSCQSEARHAVRVPYIDKQAIEQDEADSAVKRLGRFLDRTLQDIHDGVIAGFDRIWYG